MEMNIVFYILNSIVMKTLSGALLKNEVLKSSPWQWISCALIAQATQIET